MDPSEKKNIQYPIALDENNERVFVGNIDKEHRHDHTYHCPDCGEPMLPRLGDHNAKHFYHSGNHSCSKESYIHAVAKGILADRFNDRSNPFMIKLWNIYYCKNKQCRWYDPHYCEAYQMDEYNLHETYDLPAREEVWLKNGPQEEFRPDVILESSSGKHKPIFLEVYHKHKSSKKKLESGNYIIEIRVKDFSELVDLQKLTFEQSERVNFINFKSIEKKPIWFRDKAKRIAENNSVQLDETLPVCFRSRKDQRRFQDLWRVILYPSGKSHSFGLFEDEIEKHRADSIADITYYQSQVEQSFNPLDTIIINLPRSARSCHFCCHCFQNEDGTNCWCELVKNGSMRKGTFNEKKGQWCSYFEVNADPCEGESYSIWINPRLEQR